MKLKPHRARRVSVAALLAAGSIRANPTLRPRCGMQILATPTCSRKVHVMHTSEYDYVFELHFNGGSGAAKVCPFSSLLFLSSPLTFPKSCLLLLFADHYYTESYIMTICVDAHPHSVVLDGKMIVSCLEPLRQVFRRRLLVFTSCCVKAQRGSNAT